MRTLREEKSLRVAITFSIVTAGRLAFLLTLTIALHDKANDAASNAGSDVALI